MDASGADGQGAADKEEGRPEATPDLMELFRELGDGSRATWEASRDAAKALRLLFAADVSLARSAFGRTLACTGAAIAFGASAWLLLMAALVAGLSVGLGWPWALSLLLTGIVSLGFAALGGWGATRYFEHTRMQATRRQLARLGVGELSKLVPSAASGAPAKEATERVAEIADGAGPVKPDLGVEVTPP